MSSLAKSQLVLSVAAALVFFTNLGVPQLWDEDEPRNAVCAREMLARSDWVVPTFNHELRTQKPVLLYWLMMASYSVFGVNEFAARLPSAILAVGTTLVTFHLGRLLFNSRVGLLGGLMMATCLMFGVAGRAATPDSSLIFFTTLSLLVFVWAVSRRHGAFGPRTLRATSFREFLPGRWIDFAAVYAAMAAAELAKGPIGLALPLAAIGLFLLLVHREAGAVSASQASRLAGVVQRFAATAWSMRPLTMVLVVGALAAPWYMLVDMRTGGAWTRGFFGNENLARFQTAMEGHSGPLYYYIPAIFIGFFPWSIVLPASIWFSVRDALRRGERRPAHLLLVCWAGLWIALFSIAGTKLPSYVLPAYPALALVSAAFLDRWLANPACVPHWLMHSAWASLVAVGIGLAIGLPLVAARFFPGDEWIGVVGLIPLVGGLAAMVLHHRRRSFPTVYAVSITAIVLSVAAFGGAAARVSRHQNSASLMSIARQLGEDKVRLATFAHPESSVVYYSGGRVERFEEPEDAVKCLTEGRIDYVITSAERWNELRPLLPPDIGVVTRQPRFLKRGDVVLVGRMIETIETAAVSTPTFR
jgi:4-amino-4-deoxy-L-arabinose transferase-like glycosyltransferase